MKTRIRSHRLLAMALAVCFLVFLPLGVHSVQAAKNTVAGTELLMVNDFEGGEFVVGESIPATAFAVPADWSVKVSDQHAGDGAQCAVLSRVDEGEWESFNIQLKMAADQEAGAIVFHLTAPGLCTGAWSDMVSFSSPQLVQDGWHNYSLLSMEILEDGTSYWKTLRRVGDNIWQFPANWSGFVKIPLSGFSKATDGDKFDFSKDISLQLGLLGLGPVSGPMYIDTISLVKGADNGGVTFVDSSAAFIAGFQAPGSTPPPDSNVQYVRGINDYEGYGMEVVGSAVAGGIAGGIEAITVSDQYVANGNRSIKFDSEEETSFVPITAAINLQEDETAFGFYVRTPTGPGTYENNNYGNYYRMGCELVGDSKWFNFQVGSKAYLMEYGTSTWVEVENLDGGILIPLGWSGLVKFPIYDSDGVANFKSNNILMTPEYQKTITIFQSWVNATGGECGPLYLDAFYALKTDNGKTALVDNVNYPYAPQPFAGTNAAPSAGVLASSDTVNVRINGTMIAASVMSAADFLSRLSSSGSDAIKLYKDGAEVAADAEIEYGMTVRVYNGETLLSEYTIVNTKEMPIAEIFCALRSSDVTAAAKVKFKDNYQIESEEMLAADFLSYLIIPNGVTVTLYKGDAEVAETDALETGMTLKSMATDYPEVFLTYEITVLVNNVDYGLTAKDSKITISGHDISTPKMTAEIFVAQFNYKNGDSGILKTADDAFVDDDEYVAVGMVLIIVDSLSEEIDRYTIKEVTDAVGEPTTSTTEKGGSSPVTGTNGIPLFFVLAAAGVAGVILVARKKKAQA